MSIAFLDLKEEHAALLPLTYTRPSASLRVGILTIREKWEYLLGKASGYFTHEYLSKLYPPASSFTFIINGTILPTYDLVEEIKQLSDEEALYNKAGKFIAAKSSKFHSVDSFKTKETSIEFSFISRTWDIFRMNRDQIIADYQLITKDRHSSGLNDIHTKCYGNDIFLEEGASVKAAILNAENGPIYIGKNAQVHEGAIIKGPFALCEGSHVNMGAKIKGDSTIGPFSKVGGEISNSVIQGYSNKGHDGFLGNSVIGEWCNLGADTNTSNLKNNYAEVKMWDYSTNRFTSTGLQFCGLIMGDHSKCGINTMFNTGTTIGVSANIFGSGFPRNIIPSYAWGGAAGFSTYLPKKAFETAEIVMSRRGVDLTEYEKEMLTAIFDMTASHRYWEKEV
jgi:UDP-N-acetylglucosamine diphosphorylase/glucosamine-1-phosphate N-acetyltransferase